MRTRTTRTLKGEYSQALHRSKEFPKKMKKISKKVLDLRRQMEGLGSNTYEFDRLSDAHTKAAQAYELYWSRTPPLKGVKSVIRAYKTYPHSVWARNEIRHRLIRDHHLPIAFADVAAVLKMAKGYDDRTAIAQAGHITNLLSEIGRGEPAKDKLFKISDDIFRKGDKSKYMEALIDTRKIKHKPVTSPDYSEHFRRVIDG